MILEQPEPYEFPFRKWMDEFNKDLMAHTLSSDEPKCRCLHEGSDDGQHTCWEHHDCTNGICTHRDEEE